MSFDGSSWNAPESACELPVVGLLAEGLDVDPEPDWLWSASCDVELRFVESAFDSALFDWSTEPSLPGLQTRTGSLELPPELQPQSDLPKSWDAPEADRAACPLTELLAQHLDADAVAAQPHARRDLI